MATIIKTPSGTWKAIIRKNGYPTTIKTFRTKRDADDWARGTEDEMVRGIYIRRGTAERMTVADALDRYQLEVTPTKKASTQEGEKSRYETLRIHFGSYSLAAITPDLVGKFRDKRLNSGLASNTVRLDLALLGHLYTVAIREWSIGLTYNPVRLVRKPSPGQARTPDMPDGDARTAARALGHRRYSDFMRAAPEAMTGPLASALQKAVRGGEAAAMPE